MAVDKSETAPPRSTIWDKPRYRSAIYQIMLVLAVGAFFFWVAGNTVGNLKRLGINTGFDFLGSEAGFSILQALIHYSAESSYFTAIVVAVINTLFLAAMAIVFATVLGFVIGLTRLSKNWLLSRMALSYVETFRNIPLLIQILFWYFAILQPLPGPRQSIVLFDRIFINNRGLILPSPVFESGGWLIAVAVLASVAAAIGVRKWARRRLMETGQTYPVFQVSLAILIGLPLAALAMAGFPFHWDVPRLSGFNFTGGIKVIPELAAMLVALTIYHAAFVAEIVRGGILAVNKGQIEASHSLGLKIGQIYEYVLIPQALRVIVPPLANQYLNLVKSSALSAIIAYPDVMSVLGGSILTQTNQPIEAMVIVLGIYLTFSLLIAMFMNWYNRRVALVER